MAVAAAGVVLLLTIGVGIVAHELSHAAVLALFGVRCDIDIDIDVRPARGGTGQLDAGVPGTWAAVTPRGVSSGTSAWAMRLSSVAPLLLALPVVSVVLGGVPDPVGGDSPLLSAWAVGWLACAIPSPQDFSVFWYAERAIAERAADPPEE
jgi:hypothetical protein